MEDSILTKKRPRIFFGWWIVAATSVLTGLGFGFYAYGFGVMFKQVAAELGLSRAMTSLAAGIGRLESGFEAPLTGWLVDRFGPKWVMFTGVCLISLGLVAMSFVHAIWLYYFTWGVLVAGGINLAITIPIDKTLTTWFVKKRGLAMGIKMGFLSLSSVIIIPIVTWLTTSYGWRTTCLLWGALMGLSLLLVLIYIKPKGPEHYGWLPDGAEVERDTRQPHRDLVDEGRSYASSVQEEEFTLREALRSRAFWLILFAIMGQSMAFNAMTIHTIPFLTDIGVGATTAGFMMSLMVFFTAPARFLVGVLADRVNKQQMAYLLAFFFFLQSVGIAVFLFRSSTITIYLFLILFGLGSGGPGTLAILLRGRYFGRKSYGSITGVFSVGTAPAGLVAPLYAGWIYDTTGSYHIAFSTLAGITAVGAVLALFVRPPVKSG